MTSEEERFQLDAQMKFERSLDDLIKLFKEEAKLKPARIVGALVIKTIENTPNLK